MDIDIGRSVAAAVFGDKDKVKFKSVNWAQSFTSIKSGAGDLLSKGMTWTLSRDTIQGLDFLDAYFYDGQGWLFCCWKIIGGWPIPIFGHTNFLRIFCK